MIKIAVPHSDYLYKRTNRAPSLFIHTIRKAIQNSDDLELMDIGDEPEEMVANLRKKNIPDILIAIASSGVYPTTSPLLRRARTKVFLFWDDVHWFGERALKSRHRIFEAADVLLLPYHHVFQTMPQYEKYHHKSILFPWFAPMECFETASPWETRTPKIVVSGANRKDVYPLRNAVSLYAEAHKKEFEILRHPGYTNLGKKAKHNIMGSVYYSYLRNYQGAVVTSGIPPVSEVTTPYPICKFFEIPGCGCTPFVEQIPDLDELGFIPNVHYVPIQKHSYHKQLVLEASCQTIASQAQEFVLQNHSAEARCKQLLDLIREGSSND